jgi:hypothetical protein
MSEQEARLQRVTATAEDVWDDRADAREWLNKTHPRAAATEPGARRVEEILGRLRYGIPGWRNPNIDAASRKVTIMGWGASNTVKSVKTIFLCRYL